MRNRGSEYLLSIPIIVSLRILGEIAGVAIQGTINLGSCLVDEQSKTACDSTGMTVCVA